MSLSQSAIAFSERTRLRKARSGSSPEASFVAKAAVDLGFPEERIEVVERVEDAVSTALLATPTDGQIVITGSLYVVGAARSVLVS